jgi:hypothetical protein|tara:strand:+ start:624 stop:1883 length:1260 start_codon:yes stop_codon:yes gene_type:complete
MKKTTQVSLIIFLVLVSCTNEDISVKDTLENQESNEEIETLNNTEPEQGSQAEETSQQEEEPQIANIKEVLKEFPQGALSFLSNNEKQCIAEISTTESLKSMEKSLMEEGKILQEQMDYFTSCNVPGPPGIGIKEATSSISTESIQETSYSTSFASIENITSLGEDGVSPHLEIVDDKTLRLFYSSIKVKGIAVSLCDYQFNCEIQGSLERMSDLTIIETKDGIRRGYFVELNPQTNQKDIFTAIFSEDGLSYSEKTPLGFPVDRDEIAWGVPDAVTMPNGLVRVYWTYTEDKTSDEKLVSATSKTTKGIDFSMDPGYRLENGYVDFEVIKAEEGDWKALMSYTPHYMPEIPQSLFYATSKDGLEWDLIEERITPEGYTYFDPTAIPIDEKSYLVVGSAAPNVMGDREHLLFTAELILP